MLVSPPRRTDKNVINVVFDIQHKLAVSWIPQNTILVTFEWNGWKLWSGKLVINHSDLVFTKHQNHFGNRTTNDSTTTNTMYNKKVEDDGTVITFTMHTLS